MPLEQAGAANIVGADPLAVELNGLSNADCARWRRQINVVGFVADTNIKFAVIFDVGDDADELWPRT